MQRTGRGPIEDELPHGFIDHYMYAAYESNPPPYTENSGTHGPATILLDEIIIAGLDNGSLPTSNRAFVNIPGVEPYVWWLECSPFLGCDVQDSVGGLAVGTSSVQYPLMINVIPEPAGLALLGLGALVSTRRRRRFSGH